MTTLFIYENATGNSLGGGDLTVFGDVSAINSLSDGRFRFFQDGTWWVVKLDDEASLDYEAHSGGVFNFIVNVTTHAGDDEDRTVTVIISNVNEAPEFTTDSYDENLKYDAEVGVTPIAVVEAIDPEGDSFAYSITAGDAGLFAINEYGEITLAVPVPAEPIVRTDPKEYTLTVTATDTAGLTDTTTVTITDDAIRGTDGNDNAINSSSNTGDTIYGYGGDDNIYGLNGADSLYGGDGNDYLSGRSGADTLHGGDGDDNLRGGGDADTLYGGEGNDDLRGGSGVDLLWGDEDNDTLWGEADNDTLKGNAGDDRLYGGTGNDGLWGGEGNDTLWGGADDDDTLNGQGGDDRIYGGTGNDGLWGSTGDDTLYGQGGDDTLNGDNDNDILKGGAGDDTLNGDNDDDTLYGGSGIDILYGGSGDDKFELDIARAIDGDAVGKNNTDIIADFDDGDRILISREDFNDLGIDIDAVLENQASFEQLNLRIVSMVQETIDDRLTGRNDGSEMDTLIYYNDVLLMIVEDYTINDDDLSAMVHVV